MKTTQMFHCAVALICFGILFFGCSSSKQSLNILPGRYDNYIQLPNGWKLNPAGKQFEIGEMPINMILTRNGKRAITSNIGMGENSISLIDLEKQTEIQRIELDKTWYGLCFNEDESQLFVSGGNNNCIYIYTYTADRLSLSDSIALGEIYPKDKISVSGIEYIASKNLLLSASRYDHSLYVIDLNTRSVIKKIELDEQCYAVKANRAQTKAYVSIWGKEKVVEIDLSSFMITRIFSTLAHPCEIVITPDDKYLFVANANTNSTSVIDLVKGKTIETINSAISYNLPPGSTPNGLAIDWNRHLLYIANADNNYLAVFDISHPGSSISEGFIPTGWYPTAVRFSEQLNSIIVANGKGGGSKANPNGPNPNGMEESHYAEYIGKLFKGSISIIPSPQDEEFSDYAREVYRLSPSENVIKSEQLVVPALHIGAPSDSIKYVFYIIKENRTYDQVYGDIPEGNGDSSLCIFPETVTPNQHKLVKEYTLFDNFYCDAEVSADGHNWSTAAYATDYVEKNWPVLYGRNGGEYDFEGGVPIASPSSGYIWDAVLRAGLTYRNYGEFVERVKVDSTFRYVARDNYMRPYNCEDYPGFDLNISDLRRVEKWAAEFDEFERSGNLPNLSLLRLPNDHTVGTRKGSLTPTAFVAQNDYALGLIVERISQSKFWKQSIIFVVEDDAQNGADHVDAHRSCLLVISPYVKSHYVDHTLYSSSSVLKTIELILGLNPMTQFDLFANPIVMCFQNQANVNSFKAEIPRVDIEAKNITDNYDSKKCEEFDLTREDAIPDIEFNEIIWRSVKGEDSQMPAPVRSAFVTIINEDDD